MKPLHGAEPRLRANLQSFLDQRWDAPIELVAGVGAPGDPAARALDELAAGAGRSVRLVRDGTRHGANAKVSNLVNMLPAASHDLLVLSDSDMAAPPDYLARLAAALAAPGVGAVTCLYRGRGDAGRWSVLAAAAISYQFMPSVLMALRFGMGAPCMGSTIALRRAVLERIGGFGRFADVLADDHAIGEAVGALGLSTAVPALVMAHGCAEGSLAALVRHELRWSATIRAISRPAHAGLVATFPVAWALLALPLWPAAGAAALVLAGAARWWLVARVDRLAGEATAPRWMLLPRDCLSFAIWLAALFVRSVDWRGSRLAMRPHGRIAAEGAR